MTSWRHRCVRLGWKIRRGGRRNTTRGARWDLLFEGDSSRLYQKLVKGDESVVSIQGGVESGVGLQPGTYSHCPNRRRGGMIRDQIFAEIKDLALPDQVRGDGKTAQLLIKRCRPRATVEYVSRATNLGIRAL